MAKKVQGYPEVPKAWGHTVPLKSIMTCVP